MAHGRSRAVMERKMRKTMAKRMPGRDMARMERTYRRKKKGEG